MEPYSTNENNVERRHCVEGASVLVTIQYNIEEYCAGPRRVRRTNMVVEHLKGLNDSASVRHSDWSTRIRRNIPEFISHSSLTALESLVQDNSRTKGRSSHSMFGVQYLELELHMSGRWRSNSRSHRLWKFIRPSVGYFLRSRYCTELRLDFLLNVTRFPWKESKVSKMTS